MPDPITFTVEGESAVNLGFTPEIVLEEDDLPKELETGVKLRKTVTRYAGTYTSVQVHGTDLEPVELEGVFEDSWRGIAGHAREMREQIEAIVALGELVRMEYGPKTLWGTLDASFKEKNAARIEYELRFEPYWSDDPRAEIYIAFAEPPNDLASTIESRLEDTWNFMSSPPDGIDTSFVSSIIFDLSSARNELGNVLRYVSNVADYADLTAQQIGLVNRSLFSSIRTLNSTANRLRNAGDETFEATALAWTRGGDYILDGTRRVYRTLEDLVLMLRKFLDTKRPRRQRTHTVRENDTLQRLAKLYLGDFARWTEIADANDLDSTELVVGSEIKIPRR